jgi:hypothetical protein
VTIHCRRFGTNHRSHHQNTVSYFEVATVRLSRNVANELPRVNTYVVGDCRVESMPAWVTTGHMTTVVKCIEKYRLQWMNRLAEQNGR